MDVPRERICIRCGEKNRPHFNFCWKCGTNLVEPYVHKRARVRRTEWRPVLLLAVALVGGYFAVEYGYVEIPKGEEWQAPQQRPDRLPFQPTIPLKSNPPPSNRAPVSLPARAAGVTVLTEDRPWSQVEDWTVYATDHLGCFAKTVSSEGLSLIIGRVRGSADFVFAMSGRAARLNGAGDPTLTLVFDGARKLQPYFETRGSILVGRFAADAGLAREIARSTKLRLLRDNTEMADVALVGTRAALSAIGECLKLDEAKELEIHERREHELALPQERLCEDKPSNGRLLITRRGAKKQGHKMTIRNGSGGDAIVKIREERSKQLVQSFFVHRGMEATVKGLADGEFRVQFAYGDILLESCVDYANPRASQFDESIHLRTRVQRTKKQTTTYTHNYTATLYAVAGGNAPTSVINPNEFLRD